MESGLIYLGLAYAVIFLGLVGYVWSIASRQRKIETALSDLQRASGDNSSD